MPTTLVVQLVGAGDQGLATGRRWPGRPRRYRRDSLGRQRAGVLHGQRGGEPSAAHARRSCRAARGDDQQVGAERVDLGADLREAPSPSPTVRITAAIPIRMPSMVSAERSRCERTRLEPGPQGLAASSLRCTTGRSRGRRRHRTPGRRSNRTMRPRPAGDVGLVGDEHDGAPGAGAARRAGRGSSAVEAESRLPVGSSARSRSGSVTSARAMATRCCWPPDSSPGRCSTRSARPTRSSAPIGARSRRSARRDAGVDQRQLDVAPARTATASRLNCWNTKPTRRLRTSARSGPRTSRSTSSPASR